MHSDQDEGYSSFSDTDAEEGEGKNPASTFWLGHLGAAASYQPWSPSTKGPGVALVTC